MINNRATGNCSHNILYVRFNEDFGREGFFSFDMQYPSLFNIAGQPNGGNSAVLRNVSSAIENSVNYYKESISMEAANYNKVAENNSQSPTRFDVTSTYAVTFNMNSVLSCILDLIGQARSIGVLYNTLSNYNVDLITGRELTLADVFNTNVDYINLVSEYIKSTINKNVSWYYALDDFKIPAEQAFYLTFDGVVIYFGVDEIAPKEFGIPKFKMKYADFATDINPRLFCAF